jgi:hypothetical protein
MNDMSATPTALPQHLHAALPLATAASAATCIGVDAVSVPVARCAGKNVKSRRAGRKAVALPVPFVTVLVLSTLSSLLLLYANVRTTWWDAKHAAVAPAAAHMAAAPSGELGHTGVACQWLVQRPRGWSHHCSRHCTIVRQYHCVRVCTTRRCQRAWPRRTGGAAGACLVVQRVEQLELLRGRQPRRSARS